MSGLEGPTLRARAALPRWKPAKELTGMPMMRRPMSKATFATSPTSGSGGSTDTISWLQLYTWHLAQLCK